MLISFIKKNRHFIILILLIIISSACQFYKMDRDLDGYHEFNATAYILLAKNLLIHGLQTKLAPVLNINPLNDNFSYYLNHPFLAVYIYAAIFKIFTISVFASRLASMFFFYSGTVCLYFLAARLFNKESALWTCFFYVFFPLSQYYGKIAGMEHIALLFVLLFLMFYVLWIKEEKPVYFSCMISSFILACSVDWLAYCLIPLTILHYRYYLRKNNRNIFILFYAGVILFGSFVLYNYFLTGSFSGAQSQWSAIGSDHLRETGSDGLLAYALQHRMRHELLLTKTYYSVLLDYYLISFTLPVALIVIYYSVAYRKFNNSFGAMVYFLFAPAIYLLFGLVFPKFIYDHFFVVVYMSVFPAVVCAIVVMKFPKLVRIVFMAIFLVSSFTNTSKLYAMNNTNQHDLMLGKAIKLISSPIDGIAVSQPYYSPFTEYFSQRKILYDVVSLERLDFIVNSGKIKYFITNQDILKRTLVDKHNIIFLPYNFMAFDFKKDQPNEIVSRYNMSFTNGISLIDYNFSRSTDGYLRLDYAWEKSEKACEKFMVFVHFENQHGEYIFGQDHYIYNGFQDMMSPGKKTVKESFIVRVPDSLKDKEISVYLGLYSPSTGLRVGVLNMPVNNNRIYLGKII